MKGVPPLPRDCHSCTSVGNNLFVFGGTDGTNPFSDLHVLLTSSNTWVFPSVNGKIPSPREGHSASAIGNCLFLFCGSGKSAHNSQAEYYNDLFILNCHRLLQLVWLMTPRIWCAQTSGIPPVRRCTHTCSSWKNKIIVIGGDDSNDYYLSDVNVLDTETKHWSTFFTPSWTFNSCIRHWCMDQAEGYREYGSKLLKSTARAPKGFKKILENHDVISSFLAKLDPPFLLSRRDPMRYNMNPNAYEPLPERVPFEGKVTKIFQGGFNIETVIDGKTFHGVVFFNNPSANANKSNNNPSANAYKSNNNPSANADKSNSKRKRGQKSNVEAITTPMQEIPATNDHKIKMEPSCITAMKSPEFNSYQLHQAEEAELSVNEKEKSEEEVN